MRDRHLFLALLVGAVACTDQPFTAPTTHLPRFDIADAARDYKRGFYWLPPIVKNPVVSGTFDAALSPTVEICELEGDACGPVIATYTTTTGPGGELVSIPPDDEQYLVRWHTNEFDLSTTKIYRVSVYAGVHATLLGYADVQPVSTGGELKNVDTDEYIGLKDGRTLLVKFRVESDIVGRVDVQPLEATTDPGGTQQFVAIVSDLHGNVMSANVVWTSSDEDVAKVNQTGLATAVADGEATITATSERISASARLTVEGSVFVISGGRGHTCMLTDAGLAYCWGRGSSGQLGDGGLSSRARPVAVAGGLLFTSLETGSSHTCGISVAGDAYCWGSNFDLQLGAPAQSCAPFSSQCARTPSPVFGGLKFAAISAALSHTCGVTTDGGGYCWGRNTQGKLGTVEPGDAAAPRPVAGTLTFASISAADLHTCGLTTGGAAYCWGDGLNGKLGNGSTAHQASPTPVFGNLTFASLASGLTLTCALTPEGKAYCWGSNSHGQLGNGSTVAESIPVPVSGDLVFETITVGFAHACGITTDKKAYCWGSANLGALGNNQNFGIQATPTPVSGAFAFSTIGAGANHTCAVTVEDKPYCWGDNVEGQLGGGSLHFQWATPQPVLPLP